MDQVFLDANLLPIIQWKTCQEIEEFLRGGNASDYESKNMTLDAYVASVRSPHCIPKPYTGPQGWKKWTVTTLLSAFLIFGLIGNLLSALIMFRRSRRGLSSYFYLSLLAIIDICVLYTGGLLFLLETAFNYHPQLSAPIFCRLGFFVQHFFTYVSAWLIVAVTFERFIVVRFPFQSIRVCRLHVAYTITLIIFVFFAVYASHDFVTLDIASREMQTEDGYHPNYLVCDLVIYRQLLATVDLCFYSLLPSLFILIFNILIVYTMFYAIKQRRNYLQASSGLRTTDTCPRLINPKPKSSSSARTPFFRSRSIGKDVISVRWIQTIQTRK